MITNLIVYLTLTEMVVLYNHVQGDSIPNQQNTQLRVPIEVRSADTQAYSNVVIRVGMKDRSMEC